MRPVRLVEGERVQLLPIGDLAGVLGRSVSHVRRLEGLGVLPPAHARRLVRGHAGWRLYRADFVLAVAQIAQEEGLTSSRAVADLSSFRQRVWQAYRQLGGRTVSGLATS